MALRVLDAVDCLMLTGESQREVDSALAKYVSRGARVILESKAVGRRWTAACTLVPQSGGIDITDRLKASELRERASDNRTASAFNDGCRVTAIGTMRVVSGPSSRQVSSRLQSLARLGYQVVGEIVQDKAKWVVIVEARSTDLASEPYRW